MKSYRFAIDVRRLNEQALEGYFVNVSNFSGIAIERVRQILMNQGGSIRVVYPDGLPFVFSVKGLGDE